MPGGRHCCVNECSNGDSKIKKWKTDYCTLHLCNLGTGCCICEPPFRLLTFPTESKDHYSRSIWIRNVNRQSTAGIWRPNNDSRICSTHFVDGEPTAANPYPNINMGHSQSTVVGRHPPQARTPVPNKKRKSLSDNNNNAANDKFQTSLIDHDYLGETESFDKCAKKDVEIQQLKNKIKLLESRIQIQQQKLVQSKTLKTSQMFLLSTDKKVKFYTGFPTKAAWNAVYNAIQPTLKQVRYWKGPSYHCSTLKHKVYTRCSKSRKLNTKEEMLLTFMKLRLGLLDEDLADRFQLSTSSVSRIFTTWVKILKRFLVCLVFNPEKEDVRSNLPPSFKTPKHSQVRHIIDCSEIFIEKPQNLQFQNQCWSDYKHHHTAKYLVSINPSGMINFVSDCWGGRASDKHITLHSGFMDIIESYDCVMADKGFSNLLPDFTLLRATLMTPPGRHGVSQMSCRDVAKTKEIANRRIFVEQAIRRMKCFRIIKYECPLTLCQHLDDILKIICAMCNMYPPLPKY